MEVALAARRADLLEGIAADIRQAGGRARVYELDVADAGRVVEVMQRADDELGGIDLVIANAGIGTQRASRKLTWEDCAPTLAVNVAGATATLTALRTRMVERRRGHLVGVSSLAGYRGLPGSATYCASKAYLSVFLESLRADLRAEGVAVTDIRPGFVRTPMTAKNRFPMPFML
ncbi:MAG: SDR family NAD(P)-dependent oxidoreductase, partial [Myxococcales bacterium]